MHRSVVARMQSDQVAPVTYSTDQIADQRMVDFIIPVDAPARVSSDEIKRALQTARLADSHHSIKTVERVVRAVALLDPEPIRDCSPNRGQTLATVDYVTNDVA